MHDRRKFCGLQAFLLILFGGYFFSRELVSSTRNTQCSLLLSVPCNLASCYGNREFSKSFANSIPERNEVSVQEIQGFEAVPGINSQGDCCWECATKLGCRHWLWTPNEKTENACRFGSRNTSAIQNCKMLDPDSKPYSMIGGKCDPETESDSYSDVQTLKPDLNPFSTPMAPGTVVCLFTNSHFHMNGRMAALWVPRNNNGTSGVVGANFLCELGLVWVTGRQQHSAVLAAAPGKVSHRKRSFLRLIEVDNNVSLPRPKIGEKLLLQGGFSLELKEASRKGKLFVETFSLVITGVVDMDFSLSVADSIFQTEAESFVHFELLVNEISGGEQVAGVLGQVYNEVQAVSDLTLTKHSAGFPLSHFVSSRVLQPDCPASTFKAPAGH